TITRVVSGSCATPTHRFTNKEFGGWPVTDRRGGAVTGGETPQRHQARFGPLAGRWGGENREDVAAPEQSVPAGPEEDQPRELATPGAAFESDHHRLDRPPAGQVRSGLPGPGGRARTLPDARVSLPQRRTARRRRRRRTVPGVCLAFRPRGLPPRRP